ncbi:MAG: hypothetical protein Q7K34_01110 [archaeon]|nr:hypothetical protein [archaeon]
MVKRKLSELLDEVNNEKPPSFWRARLIEMQGLLNEKKYSVLERRIHDLLESDRATGRVKLPKAKVHKEKHE